MNLGAEAEKFFFECDCVIHASGRSGSIILPRLSTGQRNLKDAEAVVAATLRQHTNSVQATSANGLTLAECIAKFIRGLAPFLKPKTIGQHKLVIGRLQDFCAKQGVLYMRELSVDLLEDFNIEGLPNDMKGTSVATQVAKVRAFLREAERREWLEKPLLAKLRPVKAVYQQKDPFSDAEVDAILAESLNLNGGTHAYAKSPQTLRLLLELMLETGMRVGDAVRYDPTGVRKGDHLWIYTFVPQKIKKTDAPKPMDVFLTDRLKIAIDQCHWLSPKRPFAYGWFENENYLANEVYYRMQTIGERCGVDDCRPHRLRDTFAIRKLLAGFKLEDVSRLLGHQSIRVTERFYAKWVRDRSKRLEHEVAASQGLVNA
jgi:integrase/recombinase XerD